MTNRKRLFKWGFGFILLFIFNIIVEAIILPAWNLDNTPKNDIYFQLWWVLVGFWLIFGIPFLKYIESNQSLKKPMIKDHSPKPFRSRP